MRPIASATFSVNHRAPSGPLVMPRGSACGVGTGNSLIAPAVVMRPILSASRSVNHMAPSGPTAMSCGNAPGVGTLNSEMAPPVVMRPMLPLSSANQSAPSGPLTMP